MDADIQSPFLGFQTPLPPRLSKLCDKAFFRSLMSRLEVLLQEDYDWDKYDTFKILCWLMTVTRGPKHKPKKMFGPTFCVDCRAVLSGHEAKRCIRCAGKEGARLRAKGTNHD